MREDRKTIRGEFELARTKNRNMQLIKEDGDTNGMFYDRCVAIRHYIPKTWKT